MTPAIVFISNVKSTQFLIRHLLSDTCDVIISPNTQDSINILLNQNIRSVIVDLETKDININCLFDEILHIKPRMAILVLTSISTLRDALDALKIGAKDYIIKEEVTQFLPSVLVPYLTKTQKEKNGLLNESDHSKNYCVPKDSALESLYTTAIKTVLSSINLLIEGETGTGKDVLARHIHQVLMPKQAFIPINCGAINHSMSESELFGHEKGSFTDAYQQRIGKLELANKGILFLDEIGTMPLDIQAKLLRVIEDKKIYRIGATKPVEVDFHLISATNISLESAVKTNTFREDLYYRICQKSIYLPPLRHQLELLPTYINHYSHFFCKKYKKSFQIPKTKLQAFYARSWPGNFRELRNEIQNMIALEKDEEIQLKALPLSTINLKSKLEIIEKHDISRILEKYQHNISRSASKLGLKRSTLQKKISKYKLTRP